MFLPFQGLTVLKIQQHAQRNAERRFQHMLKYREKEVQKNQKQGRNPRIGCEGNECKIDKSPVVHRNVEIRQRCHVHVLERKNEDRPK